MMFGAFQNWTGELNANFLKCWMPHINSLARDGNTETINLWHWTRHHFSIASAASLYGPGSPLTHEPSLEEDFWTFEDSIDKLFSYPWPSLTLRKAYRARQRVFNAMSQYGLQERWKHAGTSRLIQARAEMMAKYGFSRSMFGQGESSMLFAALVNTAPMAFWLLSFIFADRTLLEQVREEVDSCVCGGKERERVLNVTKLKTHCPLFNSTLREVLRITATMNINRWVREDTQLVNNTTGETFLLKKDSMVAVAANVMHFEEDTWGQDARSFNARRFLPTLEKGKGDAEGGKNVDIVATFRDEKGKLHSGAFRSFGGGKSRPWLGTVKHCSLSV